MHEVEKELAARELGQLALGILEGIYGSDFLDPITESNAVHILQDIQDVLNNGTLTDFQCVEEIVSIFERSGLSTSRHDFG